MRKLIGLVACLSGAVCASATAMTDPLGNETTDYSYDALGRLELVQYSGTPSTTQAHSLCYDASGNRTVYKSSASGIVANCSPTPTPTPTGNQPPVANPDIAPSIPKCGSTTVNVTANDTDPEGNLPLVVTGASGSAALSVTVLNSTTLSIESLGGSGSKTFSYTVRDSLGATSTGSGTITVTTVNTCP